MTISVSPIIRARKGAVMTRSLRTIHRSPLALSTAAITVAFLFPFYWILAQSLESSAEFSEGRPRLWPRHPTLANYRDILANDGFGHALANSALVSLTVAGFTVVASCLAAYSLNRLIRRGKSGVLGFFILAGFFPMTAMIGPLFLLFRGTGLLNTLPAVILADLVYTLPLATWLLTSLFEQLPWGLEEAARVDGCTRVQALRKVIVPLTAPSLVTVMILSFILSWNDFTFALSFLSSQSRYTAPLAMVFLGQSKYQIFYNRTDAAVIIITVPIALLVFVAQRRIVSGLTAGALK
jgi:ABC-type glycerol-3-phosphate transport system permease component